LKFQYKNKVNTILSALKSREVLGIKLIKAAHLLISAISISKIGFYNPRIIVLTSLSGYIKLKY
jgi:hypothetical protein